MIALDTNVLLRLLLRDAPAQATAAQRAIESAEAAGDTVLINDLVLAEPVWTLASRYGIDKPGVLLSLQTLLDTGTFVFESRTTLLQAAAQLPTSSDDELGNKNWGLGPTAVVLHLDKGSPWVYGALVNNIWSVTGGKQGGSYDNGLIQPFLNYNFPQGFYLTSSPIASISWQAEGEKWAVPLGGGVGKIFHLGKLPVNSQLSAYYNVVHPDNAADWQLRFQVQFMFPK